MQHSKAVMMVLFGGNLHELCRAILCARLKPTTAFKSLPIAVLSQCFIITLVACLMKKTTPWRFFASLCVQDIWIGGAMGLSYCFYVFALLNTSVASALFILSIGPVFAAVLAWMFLGAPPTIRATISIIGALIGVGIMMLSGADLGRGLGNFYAVLCAFFFAVMLVIARGSGRTDVLSGNFLGAFFAMIWMGTTALVLSDTGLRVSTYDLTLMISMGVVTIGMGMAMVARASPFLAPCRAQRADAGGKLARAPVGVGVYGRGVKLVRGAGWHGIIGKRGFVGVAEETHYQRLNPFICKSSCKSYCKFY